MDAVAGLLDGPRARGAFLLRSSLDPPWALRIQDEAPLTLVAVVRGECLIVPAEGEPVRLRGRRRRDRARARPVHRRRRPGTPPQAVIHPGQACTTPEGAELKLMNLLGTRTWGNSPDGETVLLTGTYQLGARSAAACCARCRRCWS